jgi:PAS domain-containing protein
MMSIRYKFFLAFSALVVLACSVAFSGFRGIAASGDLAVRLYDGPLMGINHARSAHAALNEARRLIPPGLADGVPAETVIAFRALLNEIAGDLKIVRERIDNDDVAAALAGAEDRFRDWSETELQLLWPPSDGLTMVPASFALTQKGNDAAKALDDLVETVAAYGFEYRMAAETAVADARTTMLTLAIGTTLVGIMLAVSFSYSMSKPIFEAMQVAERVAAGNFTDQIASQRPDELGRLLRSLDAMQSHLKARADEDHAMMMKLDAALNNMKLGLCMFGPDNRLMLWNDRYLKMYRISPERIFVGCTHEEMLEAREVAGTAYRDLGHYAAKLQTAVETRSPDSFAAELIETAKRQRDGLLMVTGDGRSDGLLASIAPVLAELLAGLTTRQRVVARLSLIEDLRQAEVAEQLEVARATVSVTFRRAHVRSIGRLRDAVRAIFATGVGAAGSYGATPAPRAPA